MDFLPAAYGFWMQAAIAKQGTRGERVSDVNKPDQINRDDGDVRDEEKIQRVIEWLTRGHLFSHGGYEYDHIVHGQMLFVAELDDAKERQRTLITKYRIDDLVSWYDRAKQYADEYVREDTTREDTAVVHCPWPDDHLDYGDWSEAFGETKSQGGAS